MGNCISDYVLSNKTNDIPLYSMNGEIYRAKIVDVYDGDTCTAVFKKNFKFIKYKIRMLGYDSPEIKPLLKNKNREEEIKLAIKSKEALENHVKNKIVILHCNKFDKYGRLLGTLYTIKSNRMGSININQWMIDNNYGKIYNGGTKN